MNEKFVVKGASFGLLPHRSVRNVMEVDFQFLEGLPPSMQHTLHFIALCLGYALPFLVRRKIGCYP